MVKVLVEVVKTLMEMLEVLEKYLYGHSQGSGRGSDVDDGRVDGRYEDGCGGGSDGDGACAGGRYQDDKEGSLLP